MAIYKAVRIVTQIVSDGTTTSFTVKLAKDGDPYLIGAARPGGVGARAMNWFTDNPAAQTPKAVKVISGAISAGIAVSTSILTVTIDPKPNGTLQEIVIDLLFA